jgi:hypothetical protein
MSAKSTDTAVLPDTDIPEPSGQSEPSGPSEELHQLDFLMGLNRCVGQQPADGSEATVMLMDGAPTLGGHYLNVEVSWPGTMTARWIFGWNKVDLKFNVYFIADSGSQGTATSAGWQDGQFVVTGLYAVAEQGAHRVVRDIFTKVDDDHFVSHSSVKSEADDTWISIDTFDCHRVTTQPGE